MSLTVYIKAQPKSAPHKTKIKDRYFYILISLVGLTSVIFALWPYFLWQVTVAQRLNAKIENYPVPQTQVLSAKAIQVSNVQVVKNPDGFSYFTTAYKPQGKRPPDFRITIPKLKIENALVKVDNLTFKNNLSHFPGSALPSEIGNAFVTGHSVLPQFNNPADYSAIFTKLDTLEVGDEVYVDIGDQ